jgi:diguanylate cyclase (GGDEF)-like protein
MNQVYQKSQTSKIFNDSCNRMKAGKDFFIAFFDINMMKLVNDTLGHLIGDKVIERTHEVVLDNIRHSDSLIRFGGDEFVVFFPNSSDKSIKARIKTIQKSIRIDSVLLKLVTSGISTSVGVVRYDLEKHNCLEELLSEADELMYSAKLNPPYFISFNETLEPQFFEERRGDTSKSLRKRTYYAWIMSTISKEEPDWNMNILLTILKEYWNEDNTILDNLSPNTLIFLIKTRYGSRVK